MNESDTSEWAIVYDSGIVLMGHDWLRGFPPEHAVYDKFAFKK